jgi:hypothetical protein
LSFRNCVFALNDCAHQFHNFPTPNQPFFSTSHLPSMILLAARGKADFDGGLFRMRRAKLLIAAAALAAFSGLPLVAQQPAEPQSAPSQPGAAAAVPAPSTANPPEANSVDLRPVSGELVSKLDTKNAKNGDPVVVKTTEKTTMGDGVVIPKGSKITGHITDVQATDGANPNSKVAIQFDQAELKGGQTLPIKSVLQSVEPASGSDSAQSGPYSPGPAPSTGSAPGAPTSSGGGAGSAGGAVAPGSSPGGSSQAPMRSPSAAAPASPGAAPSGYPAAGTVVAHQGNIEIKTTAIPGVLLASNANGMPFANASGALLGARQNVHLDGGTKVTLAIADANKQTGNIR